MNIEDLKPDRLNVNKGTQRGEAMIEKSLEKFGGGRGVVVDKNNNIVAGNHLVQEAATKGFKIKVVDTEGDTIVVTRRKDWDLYDPDAPAAREYSVMDNRSSQAGFNLDAEMLALHVEQGVDFGDSFRPAELEKALSEIAPESQAYEGDFSVRYELVVECASEEDQEALYNELTQRGLKCRVLTL